MLLLGLGLCGVDQLIPSSRAQEFGGSLSGFGALLSVLAVLLFCGQLLQLVLVAIADAFRRRR